MGTVGGVPGAGDAMDPSDCCVRLLVGRCVQSCRAPAHRFKSSFGIRGRQPV